MSTNQNHPQNQPTSPPQTPPGASPPQYSGMPAHPAHLAAPISPGQPQPPFAPPGARPAAYAPGAYTPPGYAPPGPITPGYGQVAPGQVAPGQVAPGQVAPGQPGYGQPGYGQQAYAQPGYAPPGYAPPAYGQPAYGQPGYAQPGYAQPAGQSQPGYAQPAYGQPGPVPVAYGQPGQMPAPGSPYPQPPLAPPGYAAPQYQQPQYQQPGVARPAYPAATYPPQPVPVAAVPVAAVPVAAVPQAAVARAAAAPATATPAAAPAAAKPTAAAAQPVTARTAPAPQPTPIQPLPARPQPVAAAAPAPAAVRPAAPRPVPVTAAATAPAAARPIPVSSNKPLIVARHQPDDETLEEEEKPIEERILKAAPPWMVSLVVHMIALVVMGLWYIASTTKQQLQIEAIYSEELGVQLQNDQLDSGLMEQIKIEDPSLSIDNVPVNDPFAAPPELPKTALDGNVASDTMVAPSIGLALSGREKGSKSQLLGKYGGNATTEAAVRLGLEWLSRQQQATGTWSLTGPYSDGAGIENRCSATAMALLAFQGAGHTHREGDFKKEVSKGWKALLGMQNKDGVFYHEGVQHQGLYAQAQATIAICELYGMTKDKDYKLPAQRAIDYAVKIQAPEGGWRYVPGQDSDTSVTGWYVIALQSALMAGLEVPSPTLEKISKYLDSVGSDNMTRYSYRPGGGATETMTAEALLCRQYLSWKHEDPRLKEGVNLLLESPIRWDFDNQNVYYWYYATQVMHHMEGEPWKRWNDVMREVIPKQQEKTGKNAGSWSPSNDRWGGPGGRLYETCLCIYMLEVYYRHLPIYKWKQQ